MQLSKHFKLEEFTKSMTATRKGIKNDAGAGDIKNLENLCYEVLEPVRAKFDKPITIGASLRYCKDRPALHQEQGQKLGFKSIENLHFQCIFLHKRLLISTL